MKNFLFVIFLVFLIQDAFPQSNVNEGVNVRFANRKKEGHYSITQIGLLMGTRKLSEQNNYYSHSSMKVAPSVTMINGGMFNEYWAAGVGAGFELFDHNLFPVFIDIRRTLRDNDVSPFFTLKIGYAIGNLWAKHYDVLYLDHEPYYSDDVNFRNHGGLMLQPEMGVKIPLTEKSDLLFTVAYRYQRIKTTVSQDTGQRYKWEYKANMNRLSFGVAIMFR